MKNVIKLASILACLAAVSVAGQIFAQEPIQAARVSTYDLQILSLPLTPAQAPNASIVGAGGNSTYYYWVVAKFVQGNATPSPAGAVYFAPDILSGSRYVSVSWPAVTGAIAYDLLRSSTPNLPASGAIAVSLDQGGTSFNDQGGALSNYTVNTYTPPIWLDAAQSGIKINGSFGASGQCLTSTGTATVWGNCGSGSGLPTSWTIGSNNAVTAAPTASTDTTPLTVASALSSGGSADIFDVCQTSPCTTTNKFFWVTWNGNLGFQASNLQLSTNGAAPYFYLNGINAYPGQPYFKTATAELGAPTLAVSNSGTGGTVAAGTYYFKITYVNPAGETVGSTEAPTTTTGSTSAITVTAPGAQYSAFGYQIYEASTSGSEKILVPTSSNCTLATATFGGNAVCAVSANATFTSIPTAGSLTPPTTNTTGGAYIAAFAPAADGLGMFLTNNAPGADAPIDSGLMLPGGTGVNFTSGASTPANTLACLSGSNTVSECGANAANTVIGVFSSSGQNSLVQTTGIATVNLAASATTTANDFACSNATAGTIVDNGTTACASGQQVGIIAQTNAVAATSVPVLLRFTASVPPSNTTATVGTTAIAANTCTAQTAISMFGLTASMTLNFTATSDTSGVIGWGSPSAGLLYITDYPSAGSVNWKVCNPTSSSITPGASVTFNVSAR